MNTVEIPLGGTPVSCALVDVADYESVAQFSWTIMRGRYTYYARRTVFEDDGQHTVLLHRFLTNAPVGMEVHHINDNGLDCRRDNMRVLTPSANRLLMLRRKRAAIYRGVAHHKTGNWEKWSATLTYEGKPIRLGLFDSAEQARDAYNSAYSALVAQILDKATKEAKRS